MNKKTLVIALLAILVLPLITGCSRKDRGGLYASDTQFARGLAYDDTERNQWQWEGTGYNPEGPAGVEGQTSPAFKDMSNLYGRMDNVAEVSAVAAEPAEAGVNAVERKLVKRADIRIRVENLETANASVAELLQEYNAYAASSSVQENDYYYSLRVPAPHYDAFLAAMNGMGRLLRRSENTEDVTLRYYDLEGRLETKKELLRTFQSYLRRASNIEEILKVEARISELQYDIEGTGQQLRHLANRVDYATIELHLMGPAAVTPSQSVTFGEQLKQLFGSFGGFLAGVAVVILGVVIYGIPILLLVVFFFWLLFGRIGLLKKLWRLVAKK